MWIETIDDYEAQYMQIEPRLLNNKAIQQELAQSGQVKYSTVHKALELPEGQGIGNFFAREFNKRHQNAQQQQSYSKQQDDLWMKNRRDDYYYHVLPTSRLQSVLEQGLIPNKPAVFSNYKNHSRGKIFLCEKEGVAFWKMRIEEHLFHNSDEEDTVATVRIRKDLVKTEPDQIGTADSNSPCYYIVSPVSPQNIESV